ncbi:unnamed protein product [Rotaria sordida]|uniref:Uncharacterized protein n=1 Tax=Rotaria sordida TaxID=392033 RepID=A0A814QLS0_9BILA|nr:unnamed protein product [Rotaria sordida]CAF1320805.1 unnamed protein product [Rotaria sordida]CAF3741824.1 unnamed protein product [Rotaria sordida]CAF3770415.1 unnamed protein product [Rotaria sordida]
MANLEQPPINDDINAADILLQDPSLSSVNINAGGPPQLPSHILQIIDHELNSSSAPSLADIQAYPTAAYFNKTVIPIIIEGLSIVARERPKKPIEYLAAFFIKNRERFGESV